LVPLVANVALVVEIEKVNVKLDVVIVNLAKVNDIIMQGVGDAEPVPVVPSVPSASLVSELIETGILLHDEIRNQARKTRDCMEKCSAVVILFITVLFMIHKLYTPVCSIKEPAVCESTPSQVCQMSDVVCLKCMAGIGFKYARDMLNQTIYQK
jgi:hypothetical protein